MSDQLSGDKRDSLSRQRKLLFFCYKITCEINGKSYIGIATGSAKRRFNQHTHDARRGAKTPLHQAIRRHGISNFSIEVLAKTDNWEEICELERSFIRNYNTLAKNGHGYNLATGGQGPFGVERSQETREKLRQVTKRWLAEDPERMRLLIEAGRNQASDPAQKDVSRRGAHEAWQRPGYREKVLERVKKWAANNKDLMSRNQKKVMQRPGIREHIRQKAQTQMKDPKNRELSRQGALAQGEDESFELKMKAQMKEVGRRNWQDPSYRDRMRKACSKPVVVAGIQYPSLNQGAKALGLRPNSLLYRIKSERYPDYYYLRPTRYVVVVGVRYASVNAAAKALGITHSVCLRRLKSPDFPEYQFVEESAELGPDGYVDASSTIVKEAGRRRGSGK
jgi:group I intron endonuclease